MADPNNPLPPDSAAKLDALANSSENAGKMIDRLHDGVNKTGTALQSFDGRVSDTTGQLDRLQNHATRSGSAVGELEDAVSSFTTGITTAGQATDKQTIALGLLINKALGAREAFTQLGAGIDTSRLNTFTGQWNSLTKTLMESGGSISDVIKNAETLLGKALPDAVKKGGIASITDFMTTMMRAQDNTLRLQNALIQLTAKTGNLTDFYRAAGPHLQNINELINEQRRAMIDTAQATSMLPEQVEGYFAQLGTIPDALSSSVAASNDMISSSVGDTSGRVSMLTATILTAVGTGREYADVITDLKTAFRDFGITGEDALKFSTAMSQISRDNKVDLDSVQTALRATADQFTRFADAGRAAAKMSMGLSENMDAYVMALQQAGMSGAHAIQAYQGIAGAIDNMSIAQKAYLSQQTGGPGGLMGAFQVEKMLKMGDIKGVMEKVRQEMERMAGPAVTVEEAAVSPAAAARLTRQIELLKQGPLGQFAKTDQDAYRIMEAFKTMGQKGAAAVDFKDILKEPMDKGLAVQEKSLTELQRIRIAQERTMVAGEMAATRAMAPLVASPGVELPATSAMQRGLIASAGEAGMASGRHTEAYRMAMQAGQTNLKTANEMMAGTVKDFSDLYKFATGMIENAFSRAHIAMPTAVQNELNRSGQAILNSTGYQPLGTQARATAATTATHLLGATGGVTPSTPTTGIHAAALAAPTGGGTSTIDVNVKGVCIQCGRTMDNSEHALSVNPTIRR